MDAKIDEVDKLILSLLHNDARASFSDIAHKLNISEGTVHVRVKKMKKAGIIKGYRTVISPEALEKGLTAFVFVKAAPSLYNNVLNALTKIEDIIEIHDVTGEHYAILKVKTLDTNALSKIIDKIGAIEGVVSTQTAIVLKTLKEELF